MDKPQDDYIYTPPGWSEKKPQPEVPPVAPPPLPGQGANSKSLSPEDYELISQANVRARKLRKAGKLAKFNGVTFGFFAVICGLCVLGGLAFGSVDVVSLVMGVGLGAIAYNELRGRKMLMEFDLRAPAVLGWNQVALMALIVGYCGWMMYQGWYGPNPLADVSASSSQQVKEMLEPFEEIARELVLLVYSCVIVATLIFQGINAIYYFTRKSHLRNFIEDTPDWVIEIQRRTAD